MSNTDIEALIKTTIQTKVIEAFNQAPEMVEKMIEAAFSKEVNQHGGKPDAWASDKMPWLEWLVGEQIRRAAQDVMKEYIQSNKHLIEDKVKRAVVGADFGVQIGGALGQVLAQDYNWTVELKVEKQ